jgi:hypothetical protein
MEDTLIELLETFGYPVIRQGSLTEGEEYPDTMITFWENEDIDESHYDNQPTSVIWDYDVNVYSTDPTTTYSLLDSARSLLRENGFIIARRGYDLASDTPSQTGRGMNVVFIQNIISGGI